MRAVVQRVIEARVETDDQTAAQIDAGLMVLVGCGEGDDEGDARWLADKVANLRIFEDDEGKMNLSVLDIDGEVLVVPNFTLYGDCRKGRRPGFGAACAPDVADRLVDVFADRIAEAGTPVGRGVFGEHMHVSLTNDGPVTLLLSSERTF